MREALPYKWQNQGLQRRVGAVGGHLRSECGGGIAGMFLHVAALPRLRNLPPHGSSGTAC